MRRFLLLYGAYLKAFFKTQMEYKASFFAGMLANFYCYLITYATFWIIVQKFHVIAGWSFPEMSVLYGLQLFTYAVAGTLFWNAVLHLEQTITEGRLDRYLLRPVGVLRQLVCQNFGYTFLGQIAVTVVFTGSAFRALELPMEGWKVFYFVCAVIGGVLLQSGSMIICGALSFWTYRSSEITSILYTFREFIKYPLAIYPRFLQMILTFVLPWALVNYYPALLILGKSSSVFECAIGYAAPLAGVLVFASGCFIFYRGLRRYNSAGN